MSSICRSIVVVLGADAERIQPNVARLPVQVVYNPEWAEGMGTSVQCGLRSLEAQADPIDAVVLLVCDQPFLTASLIDRLIGTHYSTRSPIVASTYADTVGVPILFARSLFPELKKLKKKGDKTLLKRYRGEILTVPFSQGEIDIDTPTDAQK